MPPDVRPQPANDGLIDPSTDRLANASNIRLPDFVVRIPAGPYRSLNPTTKAVFALAEAFVAFAVRGWTGPIVILLAGLLSAGWAQVLGRTVRIMFITSPLVISILLVNTFLYPGATDVVMRVGPFAATSEGLRAALQAVLRVAAFVVSVAVFSLTTPADDLLADLERRGMGRRAEFVIGAALRTIPRMRDRAAEIAEAQRSRGLDTEGSRWRRIRGIVPLAAPMVFGALTEVEEQTMALEARAFSGPGRRTVLRVLPDSPVQRGLRWSALLAASAAIVASIAGWLRLP